MEITYLLKYCVADTRLLEPILYVDAIHDNFLEWMSNPANIAWVKEQLTTEGILPPGGTSISIPSQVDAIDSLSC